MCHETTGKKLSYQILGVKTEKNFQINPQIIEIAASQDKKFCSNKPDLVDDTTSFVFLYVFLNVFSPIHGTCGGL